ncbi:MAG TPA: tetratricopeptide repeat protein, partial [Planctomycetota bacterium]|nr:tetratricopeptide repeat protein [Planctomycetota bacterium]
PGLPGPAVPSFAAWLRADPAPQPVDGLFLTEQSDLADDGLLDQGQSLTDLLVESTKGQKREELLTPDERAALVESWKSLYDWLRVDVGEPLFGRIANPDRFGLAERPQEAILFTQVDPRTGAERFPGMQPVSYERSRVAQFDFADTASNRIQERRREFLRDMSASRYDDLLAFADRCVGWRLDAREALDVAAEMYALAEGHADGDPGPRLGLARCHEAAFRFEEAYQVYLDLLESHAHRGEVHVGLAQLEARLRLFESAEERFRMAESQDRLSWRVQWAYGRFLMERERFAEALEHLELAWRSEPADPELKDVRAGLRCDLARAQLATGEVETALATFESALAADADHELARAGRLNCLRLLARTGEVGEDAVASAEQAGLEFLLDAGLAAMSQGRALEARDLLRQAAEADALRAHAAWGALSWLAETTGYSEEAFRFVEQAVEADPEDAWSAYQRGRLLIARDDLAGAREALIHALDLELDFPDAMIALAQLAWKSGEYQPADLYLERALSRDPSRAEVHALRGTGLLHLGDEALAAKSFEAALALDASQPLAAVGQAWLAYRRGDSERAIRLFAELDDRRRSSPEDDPYRAFAQAQIARLRDHESKVVWTDGFERRELRNDWQTEEGVGPLIDLLDGKLRIQGDFRENGLTRVVREYAAPDFVAVELTLTVRSANNARVGLFVSKERRRGAGQAETQGEVAVARRKDGGLVVRLEDRAAADPQWEDVPPIEGGAWWPADQPVRLRIERSGEGSQALGRIVVDGVSVAEGFPMRALSSSSSALRVGVFVEGQTGLPADVVIDDVEVVYRVVK